VTRQFILIFSTKASNCKYFAAEFHSYCTKEISEGIWDHWVVGMYNEMDGGMFISCKNKRKRDKNKSPYKKSVSKKKKRITLRT
jgi:hypothetical protein